MLALIILTLTALGGLFLLSYVLADKNIPKGAAMIHGSLGALGILMLLFASIKNASLWGSFLLFILVACGGLYLAFKDRLNGKPSKRVALGHGMGAIIALILLIYLL